MTENKILLILLTIPHLLVVTLGFMLCQEMACFFPIIYFIFIGSAYSLIILILFFNFTSAKSKLYLFLLSFIYVYCGVGLSTEGGGGYNQIRDIIMLSLGCSFGDYYGYCSKASLVTIFIPPIILLLLASLPFLFTKNKK